jgi:hypothetical protein
MCVWVFFACTKPGNRTVMYVCLGVQNVMYACLGVQNVMYLCWGYFASVASKLQYKTSKHNVLKRTNNKRWQNLIIVWRDRQTHLTTVQVLSRVLDKIFIVVEQNVSFLLVKLKAFLLVKLKAFLLVKLKAFLLVKLKAFLLVKLKAFLLVKLKASFRKFYGGHHQLVNRYGTSV